MEVLMRFFWILGISLAITTLSACSSDSHSSSEPEDTQDSSSSASLDDVDDILDKSSASTEKEETKTEDGGDEQTIKSSGSTASTEVNGLMRSACDTKDGESVLEALDVVNEKAIDLFEAFADKDFDKGKSLSTEVKSAYKKVLNKAPKNCNAQLGYAVASIVDLANNKTLNDLYSDYDFWFSDYGIESLGDFTDMITTLSKNKSFTKTAQEALENEVAPTVDSAITYMQYIVAQGDYALQLSDGEEILEMDNSEFGIALGGLFATKAAITIATSMNLEIDDNGKYDWINNLDGLTIGEEEPSADQKKALVKIVKFIGANGTFTSIYSNKQKEWKNIPNLVDSALTEIRAAFQYSLNESMTKGSQDYDLYVVGKGTDADISTSDVKDIIENLGKGLEATRGAYEVTFKGKTFVVNARKYFENVKGTEPFLPYYKFDGSDLTTFKFTNKAGTETATLISFLDGTRSFPDDGEGVIIFKDPTFGEIFPDFEQKDVWELIDKLGSIKIKFWDRDDYSTGGTTYEEYNCFYRDDNANTYYSYGECVANAYGECHEFCD
jgi:hypothetical protein